MKSKIKLICSLGATLMIMFCFTGCYEGYNVTVTDADNIDIQNVVYFTEDEAEDYIDEYYDGEDYDDISYNDEYDEYYEYDEYDDGYDEYYYGEYYDDSYDEDSYDYSCDEGYYDDSDTLDTSTDPDSYETIKIRGQEYYYNDANEHHSFTAKTIRESMLAYDFSYINVGKNNFTAFAKTFENVDGSNPKDDSKLYSITMTKPIVFTNGIISNDGYTAYFKYNVKESLAAHQIVVSCKRETTKPKILGVKNGRVYNRPVTIKATDASGIQSAEYKRGTKGKYYTDFDFINGTKLSRKGTYTIRVTDYYDNTTLIKFKIR